MQELPENCSDKDFQKENKNYNYFVVWYARKEKANYKERKKERKKEQKHIGVE